MHKDNKQLLAYRIKYQNKWVALDTKSSKVLASDKNLSSVVAKANKKNTKYVLEKVLPISKAFIPLTL